MGKTKSTMQLVVEPSVHEALWAQFVAPFLDGTEPRMQEVELRGVKRLDDLVLLGATTRTYGGSSGKLLLADSGEWTLLAQTHAGGGATAWVRAATDELLAKGLADVQARAPEPATEPEQISVDFWQVASRGPFVTARTIDAPQWSDIAEHYPGEVGKKLVAMLELDTDTIDGRIALWHGPPGTGKTTAIRSLARAWAGTRRVQVLLDPDVVFARSSHLMSVLLDDRTRSDQWRVLVIEDADELLRADAKERVGQALSRLLNLGDGILGQGLKVLVLITTNEPVRRLHPALIRPGRCLAEIEFRPFTAAEAREGLGIERAGTLAELLHGVDAGGSPEPIGQYL